MKLSPEYDIFITKIANAIVVEFHAPLRDAEIRMAKRILEFLSIEDLETIASYKRSDEKARKAIEADKRDT